MLPATNTRVQFKKGLFSELFAPPPKKSMELEYNLNQGGLSSLIPFKWNTLRGLGHIKKTHFFWLH